MDELTPQVIMSATLAFFALFVSAIAAFRAQIAYSRLKQEHTTDLLNHNYIKGVEWCFSHTKSEKLPGHYPHNHAQYLSVYVITHSGKDIWLFDTPKSDYEQIMSWCNITNKLLERERTHRRLHLPGTPSTVVSCD